MRKIIAVVSVVSIFVIVGALLALNQDSTDLSEAKLREKFRCDRITADELATDIYCENPEYYHDDAEKGAVIDSSDFDDPRYRAMYRN